MLPGTEKDEVEYEDEGTPVTYGHIGNFLLILLVLAAIWGAGAYWLDKTGMTGYVRCQETTFWTLETIGTSTDQYAPVYSAKTEGVTCPGGKQYKGND